MFCFGTGLFLLTQLESALDPAFRASSSSDKGRLVEAMPPVVRFLLFSTVAAVCLLLGAVLLNNLRYPNRAVLTFKGALVHGLWRPYFVDWSNVTRISLLQGPRLRLPVEPPWFLVLELKGKSPSSPHFPWRRPSVIVNLKGTNLRPGDVPEVLRKVRPDLLTLFAGTKRTPA